MAVVKGLEHESEAPPRRWSKRLLWITVILLAFAALIGVIRWKLENAAQADLNAVIAELDETDPQWRIEDIQANRKNIPDAENSALVIQQIEAGLRANPPQTPRQEKTPLDRASETPPDVQIEPQIQAALRAELKRVAPQVKQALSLATMNEGRFPLTLASNGIGTTINSQAAREAERLLQQEMLTRLRDGDIEGACVAARAMLVAARSIGDEPILISQLVRLACASIPVRNLERILAQGEPKETTLAGLQRILELEETTPYLEFALRGERGIEHALMNEFAEGKISLGDLTVMGGQNSNPLEKWWGSLSSKPVARKAHPELLRKLTEYIQISRMPAEVREDLFRIKEQELKSKDINVLVRLLLPSVIKVAEADNRARASLRTAIVALAAERFRLEKRRWPRDLNELTPAYLSTVPLDPYDGKPLRLRATEDGLLIYALGKDRKDNGGKVDPTMPNIGGNIVFKLWNVDARRKPAVNPEIGPPRPTEEELQMMLDPMMPPGIERPDGQ